MTLLCHVYVTQQRGVKGEGTARGIKQPALVCLQPETGEISDSVLPFTFVFIIILQVCGEGHQIPAGPGTDEWDGWAVCTLWTFLPLTHISQFHDETTEVESKMTP